MYNSLLHRNKERASAALTVLWIILTICFVKIVSSSLQYNLLLEVKAGIIPSDKTIEWNDLRETIIAIVYIIFILISVVTFISWFRRAYYNLGLVFPNRLNHTEGWAAGGWFVPIANLFIPVQIMKELYSKTSAYFTAHNETLIRPLNTTIISFWWFFWIISSILDRVVSKLDYESANLEQLIDYTLIDLLSYCLNIIACFLAILVLRNYAANEEKLKDIHLRLMEEKKALDIQKVDKEEESCSNS